MSNCIAKELLKKGKTVLYQTAPILLESVINYKMSKNKDTEVINNRLFKKSIKKCFFIDYENVGQNGLYFGDNKITDSIINIFYTT